MIRFYSIFVAAVAFFACSYAMMNHEVFFYFFAGTLVLLVAAAILDVWDYLKRRRLKHSKDK